MERDAARRGQIQISNPTAAQCHEDGTLFPRWFGTNTEGRDRTPSRPIIYSEQLQSQRLLRDDGQANQCDLADTSSKDRIVGSGSERPHGVPGVPRIPAERLRRSYSKECAERVTSGL